MVNNNSIFHIKVFWIFYKMVSAPSYKQRYNLHQKTVPLLQSIFTSYSTITCSQNPPYHPHQYPFPLCLSNFSPPFFWVLSSQQSTPKIFSLLQPFFQFRLRRGTRELGSLVRTDTVLISPFSLKVWKVVTGLTITDFLSLRLRNLVYNKSSNNTTWCVTNHPIHLLPYSQTIVITSIRYTLLIPPQELTFPWKAVA